MNTDANPSARALPSWAASLTSGVLALLAIELGALAMGAWPPLDGTFKGPDSYMRLHRIVECLGGPGCSGGIVPGSNAPFGEALHWPWLWDRILLALSAPLQLFLPLRTAVVAAAYVSGPLLGALTLLLLTLAARRIGTAGAVGYVGLLMVTQPHVTFLFSYARPDHHAIQAAVYAAALLATVTCLTTRSRRAARWFGVAFGVGVWISTEALITGLPLLLALGVLWVADGDGEAARLNLDAALAATGIAALALAIDAPLAGVLSAEFDRISIVHLALFASMAAFWLVTKRVGTMGGPGRRLLWSGIGAGAAFVAMSVAFPGFQRGPAADMAEPLWTLWLAHTAEYVPLVHRSDPTEILMAAAPALVAIPLAIWAARWTRGPERAGWYAIAGTLAWFQVLATFQQVRWSTYVHLIAVLPLAWLLGRILARVPARGPRVLSSLLRITAVCAVALGPVLMAAAVGLGAGRKDYAAVDRCEPALVIQPVADLRSPAGGPATILAPIFWGPEILWRTDQRVVSTPYHRNTSGILDSHRIMNADPVEAREGLAARGITHIAICSELPWLPYVDVKENPGSFYGALVTGHLPGWVTPIPLPEEVQGIDLFDVRAPQDPDP